MKMNNDTSAISIKPKKIAAILGAFLLLLVLLSLLGQYLRFYTFYDKAFGLIPLVNIAHDLSIPTIYEVILLFFTAILLNIHAQISHAKADCFHRQWKALAILFLYLSLDHATGIYKLIYMPFRNAIHSLLPSYTLRTWHLTPLFILIIIFAFRSLYQSLPAKTKKRIVISILLYLTAFIGDKLITGVYAHAYSRDTYFYIVLITISRSLEISSVIAFIYALLRYFQNKKYSISLKIKK